MLVQRSNHMLVRSTASHLLFPEALLLVHHYRKIQLLEQLLEVDFSLNSRLGQAYSDLESVQDGDLHLSSYLTSSSLLDCALTEAKDRPGIHMYP
jgi:hypothetical protein